MKIEKRKTFSVKDLKELLSRKARKPLSGNNRSFSCAATKRKWKHNQQKVTIDGKSYSMSPRQFRVLRKQLQTS